MQEVQHKDELTQANVHIEELKRDVRVCKDTCRRLLQEQSETESELSKLKVSSQTLMRKNLPSCKLSVYEINILLRQNRPDPEAD